MRTVCAVDPQQEVLQCAVPVLTLEHMASWLGSPAVSIAGACIRQCPRCVARLDGALCLVVSSAFDPLSRNFTLLRR